MYPAGIGLAQDPKPQNPGQQMVQNDKVRNLQSSQIIKYLVLKQIL